MHGRERERSHIVRHVSTASLFSVIGGDVRMEILQELARGPMEVSTLASTLELAIGTISHNLGILRQYRLVDYEHKGPVHLYSLTARISLERHAGVVWLCANSDDGDMLRIGFKSLVLPSANGAAEA